MREQSTKRGRRIECETVEWANRIGAKCCVQHSVSGPEEKEKGPDLLFPGPVVDIVILE